MEIERAEVLISKDGSKSIKVEAKLNPGEDVRAPGSDAKVGYCYCCCCCSRTYMCILKQIDRVSNCIWQRDNVVITVVSY